MSLSKKSARPTILATIENLNFQFAKEELVEIQGYGLLAKEWEELKKSMSDHVLAFH